MAQPEAWYINNDVLLSLSGVRSSTMAASSYLNSSTNVRVTVWRSSASNADATTTDTTYRVINARVLSYVTASDGNYRTVAQSTETTAISRLTRGLAIFTLNHSGLNAEWRVPFRGQERRTT